MTMRFLPWTRRGLAAQLDAIDDGGALPARGLLPVTVTVNVSHDASAEVATYGPGDVTGIDLDTIVRTAPRRHATNVAPDEFAAVEFDPPDLPWIFTPATAGSDDRLRPWVVLVVVRVGDGVHISVGGDTPLPKLVIEAPASPAAELPDLAESWAWAHSQVITADASGDTGAALTAAPDHNLSRLLCPRRLAPGTRYYAALVPAFDAGVDAGLGRTPDGDGADLAPAWDVAALGGRIVLPVYYHWEFTTGPAGDFESLARKLTPTPLPDGVGTTPMFVGDAHPALPTLPADDGGVVPMEGALRAPEAGPDAALDARHDEWVETLIEIVEATAASVPDGTTADAESVAPPIYGSWHAQTHEVPDGRRHPRWLRDLNADPRHRAAAGLGMQIVRAFQEEYVNEAWAQVGDVLAANRALELTRAMARVAERIHDRHLGDLDALAALSVTRAVHRRIPLDGTVVERIVARSATPDGFTARSFQRLASSRNRHMREATRRAGLVADASANADLRGLAAAPRGELAPEVGARPDGIVDTRLPELADAHAAELTEDQRGVLGELGGSVLERADRLDGAEVSRPRLRRDLSRSGILDDHHVAGLQVSAGRLGDLREGVQQLRRLEMRGAGRSDESLGGFVLVGDRVTPLLVDNAGEVRVRLAGRETTVLRAATDRPARRETRVVGEHVRGLPDVGLPRRGGPVRAPGAGTVPPPDDATVIEAVEDLVRERGEIPVTTVERPLRGAGAITAFARDLEGAIAGAATRIVDEPDPPAPLDVDAVHVALLEQTRPRPVIEARVADRIRAGGLRLADLAPGRIEVVQPHPLAPIMVGPVLDRPLYLDLARFDQERFLPGGGAIPDNAITLLETNPQFVEAFLVGANHEMNRELLWRRYPTDRRGTPFRRFWDRVQPGDDIPPIHTWRGANGLGTTSEDDASGSLVLLVRGQLLRRYPNTIIYAVPATAQRRIDPDAAALLPVFAGVLAPDISFVGFDLDVETATAGHGTLFVLQEQPSEPRFGLDVPDADDAVGVPDAWSDMSWGHVGVAPGGFLDLDVLGTATRPLATDPTVTATFGADAAHMAAITFQRPFRAAVHSSEILD